MRIARPSPPPTNAETPPADPDDSVLSPGDCAPNGLGRAGVTGVSWRDVRTEILRRINGRIWRPGELIPNEAALAEEFRCARNTVNRALRDLADAGLVVRKRKAGTRIVRYPAARATMRIPILRDEIEAKGFAYDHKLLHRRVEIPPAAMRARLKLADGAAALSVSSLHIADGRPYAFDERWINLDLAPEAASVRFTALSPNEWLVQNAPYTHGDIAFFAEPASERTAAHLGAEPGAAILVQERTTWRDGDSVTSTRLFYAPGHRLLSTI